LACIKKIKHVKSKVDCIFQAVSVTGYIRNAVKILQCWRNSPSVMQFLSYNLCLFLQFTCLYVRDKIIRACLTSQTVPDFSTAILKLLSPTEKVYIACTRKGVKR